MQTLDLDIFKRVKALKVRELETELREGFAGCMNKERCACPFCQYSSKKNKHSGVIFVDGSRKSFKCFSCGIWRRIE